MKVVTRINDLKYDFEKQLKHDEIKTSACCFFNTVSL